MRLFDIKDPAFLKQLSLKELQVLAEEIRQFLIENIEKTGGHLSSNLGTVELIIALHYVFHSPKDAILFDVGHQAYTHKILTGRASEFKKLRQTNGLSGFINYKESEHDLWEGGHAGTALSALYGLLYAKALKKEAGEGIAIVGDASILNGTSFEALNLLGSDKSKRGIVIFNDNEMSISRNVGSISRALPRYNGHKTRSKVKRFWDQMTPALRMRGSTKLFGGLRSYFKPKNLFEDLGYQYLGPIDGHNLKDLIDYLEEIKKSKTSVFLHIITQKGKGHKDAEMDTVGLYHGVAQKQDEKGKSVSWSEIIAIGLDQLQTKRKTFVIMPAMTVGTHLQSFLEKYPDQFIDIGIAEEHGAVMASMMARQGVNVFFPLYSTFSQRAFDQILNDIARVNHPVVFGIDRAGIVGADGSTHQGLFDVSMFNLMPNMVITMPYDAKEAFALLNYGFEQTHPFVIRYPKGHVAFDKRKDLVTFEAIKPSWTLLQTGSDPLVLISYGPSLDLLIEAAKQLKLQPTIVNARFIKPIDEKMLAQLFKNKANRFLVYEEGTNVGSLYPQILKYMAKHQHHHLIQSMSLTDVVVEHGQYQELLKKHQMDVNSIVKVIQDLVK